MKKRRPIGELEIEIVQAIRLKKKASVKDVCDNMKSKRKYTTIMTVMKRLFEKGELGREKIGRHYVYWLENKKKRGQGLLSRLKEKIFGGRSVAMVSYLLEMGDAITEEELDELESLIETYRHKESR
ncbi:MAG: BlaI/MecI/CopY family transcriptional regulator [Waddliaceae bacterium]